MKLLHMYLLITGLILLTFTANGQVRIIRSGPGGNVKTFKGELFDLPELGAIIVKSDSGNLKVEHIMPPEARPKAYVDVDLKTRDEILVANGKRVKTIKEIEQQYNIVPVGGEVKLGIQRGADMMISRFTKADPKDLPERKTMIITSNGSEGDIRPLPNLGIIMGKGKNGVVITELLDNADKAFTDAGIKPGDQVLSIDGKGVKTLEEFTNQFVAVPAGATMNWVVLHDGKDISLSLTRPKPQGQVIIKQEQR